VEDDPTAPITEFRYQYDFLSNFSPCVVSLAAQVYRTVEHAYQAAKCVNSEDEFRVRFAPSPGKAKRLGGKVLLRPDWEQVKMTIMADLLWQKFGLNRELRAQLLATGDRELVEGNTWHDTFWGRCGGRGTNHLGNLIMRIRAVARYIVDSTPVK
jgi:hypothetical protein